MPVLHFSFPVKSLINYKQKLNRQWFALYKTDIRWFSSSWDENNKRTDGQLEDWSDENDYRSEL